MHKKDEKNIEACKQMSPDPALIEAQTALTAEDDDKEAIARRIALKKAEIEKDEKTNQEFIDYAMREFERIAAEKGKDVDWIFAYIEDICVNAIEAMLVSEDTTADTSSDLLQNMKCQLTALLKKNIDDVVNEEQPAAKELIAEVSPLAHVNTRYATIHQQLMAENKKSKSNVEEKKAQIKNQIANDFEVNVLFAMDEAINACSKSWAHSGQEKKLIDLTTLKNSYLKDPTDVNLKKFIKKASEARWSLFRQAKYGETGSIKAFYKELSGESKKELVKRLAPEGHPLHLDALSSDRLNQCFQAELKELKNDTSLDHSTKGL